MSFGTDFPHPMYQVEGEMNLIFKKGDGAIADGPGDVGGGRRGPVPVEPIPAPVPCAPRRRPHRRLWRLRRRRPAQRLLRTGRIPTRPQLRPRHAHAANGKGRALPDVPGCCSSLDLNLRADALLYVERQPDPIVDLSNRCRLMLGSN